MINPNFEEIRFFKSFGLATQLPPSTKPEIVFVGRSNVGKSTLLNKICGNKNLAKVSSKPGKTTTINFFTGKNVILVDLPGYGFAARSKSDQRGWSSLIEGYFEQERNIQLVYVLLDVRHMPSELDLQMVDYLKALQIPFEIYFTKEDKLSKQQANNQKSKIMKLLE